MFRDAFGLSKDEKEDDALRRIRPEATVSFVADIGGKLGQLVGNADIEISSMRIGPDLLPPSRLRMDLLPSGEPERRVRVTKCGNLVTAPFDPKRWASDVSDGIFKFEGQLFGGQITFDDVQMTQQRAKMVSGSWT